jgi:release factor glutamine methyltransferase
LSTTIADAIQGAAERFARAGVPTPRLDAEVLLRRVLGLDRTQLFVRLRESLSAEDRTTYDRLVERRLAGEPIAYLTGGREFMGLEFAVGPGVLVPRPETEVLVEWALGWLRDREAATIVDVGTGSGAIALSIAATRGKLHDRIVGVDVSRAALRFAETNRARLGLDDAVHLVLGDLLTCFTAPIDLILGNLPYLRPDQVAGNPDLRAEPVSALESGPDGLDLIRRLLVDVPMVISRSGAVALEIDPSQAGSVRTLIGTVLPSADVDVLRDLAGWDRVIVGTLPSAGEAGSFCG